MFTGIIKSKGTVFAVKQQGGDIRLSVQADGLPWSDYAVGESIAVNGVCLTAVNLHANGFDADVSLETLDVTGLGDLAPGSEVNLEPALSVGERLGGHLVSGHIDCIGSVTKRIADARSIQLTLEIPQQFSRYVTTKGSICLDGVSLTINAVSGKTFVTNIIPHTANTTIIGGYAVGSRVNVEVDQLARYLERLITKDGGDISIDFLKANGYA